MGQQQSPTSDTILLAILFLIIRRTETVEERSFKSSPSQPLTRAWQATPERRYHRNEKFHPDRTVSFKSSFINHHNA